MSSAYGLSLTGNSWLFIKNFPVIKYPAQRAGYLYVQRDLNNLLNHDFSGKGLIAGINSIKV